jgi:membrane protein required for colicin V production
LNWLDVIMAIVLLGFAIRGLMKGFFRELFSLVGLFVGLWIALLKYVTLGDWLLTKLPLAEPLPYHVAFLTIFLGISIVAGLLGVLLHKVARVFLIGWLDAFVGLGFGFVKGVMITTILLFLIGFLPLSPSLTAQLKSSVIVSRLESLNPFLQQSIQVYRGFGAERLWRGHRLPEFEWPPWHEDGRAAGETLTR